MINRTRFTTPTQRKRSAYNQFSFEGITNENVGAYVNYSIQNIVLFSEVARSWKNGIAGSLGVLANLSPKLDVSFLYRNYARNFYAFYSSGFAENSNTQNEKRPLLGMEVYVQQKVQHQRLR